MGQKELWLLGATFSFFLCLTNPLLSAETVVKGRVGGAAELGCTLTPSLDGVMTPNQFSLHVVEWVRLGYNVPILIKFGDYRPRVHPNYKGRVSLAKGASLVVDDLTLEDEGWFECRILLLDRAADEFKNGTWTFLSITAPPLFIKIPPSFVEVLLGESLSLSCSALGNPKPKVIWRKEDSTVEEEQNIQVVNGTLSLLKVTRETAGTYKCHVSNSEGNLTHITQLQVKGPPVIVLSPEDTMMNMSQDAVLQCRADAYPSNLTYQWQKEGQNVYHIETLRSRVKILVDGSLLIPKLIPEDSGNYTCTPSNGIRTSPSASAYLKVKYPARVVQMPRETYLPAGMGGTVVCPVQAEPPMLFVKWTKNGASLDLHRYPGWMINSEGSVFIATANDDAVGMYTCTAYNSYGTMGQSDPTKVILKDPPSFRVSPRAKYLQEIGRELIIPCQPHGDPPANITWTKVGSKPGSSFTVLSNGSLVLRPLGKNHQGAWQCQATNSVATVRKLTVVLVLGTSPHAATAVSVDPGVSNANVSWEPGFDGGQTQTFRVWMKPTNRGKHEWTSLPVAKAESSLLVTGLHPATSYQFSILPQNKLGSGPFSEIVTIMTLAPRTDPPPVVTDRAAFHAPTSLSVNHTAVGVFLQWLPPPAQSPLITAYMLQARQEKGEWVTLEREISVNTTEILVQGLTRDSRYELRLLSHGGRIVSDPSESVNISTKDMDVYPTPPSLMTFITQPLMTGVIAGVCFLLVAIVLSVVTACVMNHRRESRRKRPAVFQRTRSAQANLPDSPSSILKMKLCPPLNFFPNSSSSNCSDRSSFDKGSRSEYQDQKKQLLPSSSPPPCYTLFESHLGGSPASLPVIESISRGPDGRFIDQSCLKDSVTLHIETKKEFPQSSGQHNYEGSKQSFLQNSPKSSLLRTKKSVINSQSSTWQESHNKSLTLMKDQKEPKSFMTSRGEKNCEKEQRQAKSASPIRRWAGFGLEEPILKHQDIPLKQKSKRPSSLTQQISEDRIGCYFGNTSSPMERLLTSSSPYTQWDISPVTSMSQVPGFSISEGNTSHCIVTDTLHKDLAGVEDSAGDDISQSSVTQCTSLSIFSNQRASPSCCEPADLIKVQVRCPEKPIDKDFPTTMILTKDHWMHEREIKTETDVPLSTCPVRGSFPHPGAVERNHHSAESEKEASLDGQLSKLSTNVNQSNTKVNIGDEPVSSFLQPEGEKEDLRAPSRKSDQCVLSVSPSHIFPLPLFENEVESDQSNFSIRLSESLKAKIMPQPDRTSPVQPSTILEYLSLPGFIEMSVDEPTEESQIEEPTLCSTKQMIGTLLRGEPDVVPQDWADQSHIHLKKSDDSQSAFLMDLKISNIPVDISVPENVTRPKPSLVLAQGNTGIYPGSSKAKCISTHYLTPKGSPQPFFPHKSLGSDKSIHLSPEQTLTSTKVVYNIPYQAERMDTSLLENAEWSKLQNKTNQISARITQAPVPLMTKSISIDPYRTLSGMGQPRPYLRKTVSLGCQKWPHHQSSRINMSNNSYKEELGMKDKSYNLSCMPANPYSRSGLYMTGTGCTKSYSSYSLERPCYNERPYMISSSLMHAYEPSVLDPPKLVEASRQELDRRRQVTVFPETRRCPLSNQETLRSVQHRYAPPGPPRALDVPRLVPRLDGCHSVTTRKSFQRPFLPRGYSWPSPHQAAFHSGERRRELYGVIGLGEGRDSIGRASYASQSSGRGSVGTFGHFRQSLSITPTLRSSPETTQESERHKRDSDLRRQMSKSKNPSIDENYEFDAAECRRGLGFLEAMNMEQTGMGQGRELRRDMPLSSTGLQELHKKSPNSFSGFTLGPQQFQQQYSRSLSDARFTALMQEFQKYRTAQESSQDPYTLPDLNHGSESALF